jgi:hypothetical protein
MSYTYSGNPQASLIDEVHYRLGNVVQSDPFATDEEVLFALREWKNNTYLAAASLAETKAYEFGSRPISVKRGDRTTTWGDRMQMFLMLAKTLRMQAAQKDASVYAGGLSEAEKTAARRDLDLVQPYAKTGLHTQQPERFSYNQERDE